MKFEAGNISALQPETPNAYANSVLADLFPDSPAQSTGEPIKLRIFARVPEGHTPAYRALNLPTGATYDPSTGLFTWTPENLQNGTREIVFTAWYDGFETSQTGIFIIVPRR